MSARGQQGIATIALVITMLILAMVAAVLASMQVMSLESATGHLHTTRAFYVAEGAMQYLIEHEFNSDTNWSDNVSPTVAYNGDYDHGPYLTLGDGRAWAVYGNQTQNSVDITVTARVGQALRILRQHVAVSIPAAFQNAQFSAGNINMNSSVGNTTGNVTATGNALIGSAVTVSGTVTQGSTLQIPQVDWNFYKMHANQFVSGNLSFASGAYGDAVNGYIWYVTGNVSINGNTTINGTIVTEGNLVAQNPKSNFTFQAVPKNVDADPAPETMPALVIQGNFDFNNVTNLTINGLVYALGNINLANGNQITLNGALVTDGNMNINNATGINLAYDPAYVSDLPGFQNQGAVAVIVSRWEEVP